MITILWKKIIRGELRGSGGGCICSRQLPQAVHFSYHVIGGRAMVSITFYSNYHSSRYKYGVTCNKNTLCIFNMNRNSSTPCLAALAAILIEMARSSGTSADALDDQLPPHVASQPLAIFAAQEVLKFGESHA